ncbi:Wadjet anti-phage system protein JetD domain-containing protein [Intrasporangium chromatireducens]|uniref:Wadjet anti-phage system protein JetD domain-containing protein n=1 Tax=Intrasporangium chromatireducens TaxID=1386088 RepID=UPI0004AD5DFD|nr:Wadjet anti-phage system protein JetD domain-containing protein [Intrasporangium chromatireducens]
MTAAGRRAATAVTRQPWSTVDDIRSALQRQWDKGELLRVAAQGAWEPVRVPLRAPSARELAAAFGPVQDWAGALHRAADGGRQPAFGLEVRPVGGRLVGANVVPSAAWFDEPEQVWRLLRVADQVATFQRVLRLGAEAHPALADWVVAHPLRALSHAAVWPKVVATVLWLRATVGTAAYLRQIDVPGVDTKFIEGHRGLLAELLDAVAPGVADETRSPGKDFARRYGFRDKPAMTRLRSLDGTSLFGGLTDVSVRVEELAATTVSARHILVVENEVTFLALPALPGVVAFFGSGFDVLRLGRLPWLLDRDVLYWGDLDTDGFVILDRLRSQLPAVRSVLMDLETLTMHSSQWTTDPKPSRLSLARLTPGEAAVYRTLRDNELGTSVRLEQERVNYAHVASALEQAL